LLINIIYTYVHFIARKFPLFPFAIPPGAYKKGHLQYARSLPKFMSAAPFYPPAQACRTSFIQHFHFPRQVKYPVAAVYHADR
jgi:hypothetical protein